MHHYGDAPLYTVGSVLVLHMQYLIQSSQQPIEVGTITNSHQKS